MYVASTTATVNNSVTLSANFTAETLDLTVTTPSAWVYQNTPGTTFDRHVLPLAIEVVTDTWSNTTFSVSVTQIGKGVVTPTQNRTSGVLVTPAATATWSGTAGGLSGYLVGGRVLNGLVNSVGNVALTGSCTVTVTVVGDVSGPANPVMKTLTVFVRKLGDVDGNGKIQIGDENYITQDIATGAAPTGIDPEALDVDGNGKVQVADENLITYIIAGRVIP
jgi:hypothetical protein